MAPVDDQADKRRQHTVGDGQRCDQQGRADRRQPAHRLRVEHQRHDRRRRERGDGHPQVAQAEVPIGEDGQRNQRLAGVDRLPVDKYRDEPPAGDDQRPDPRLPVRCLALLQAEDDQKDAHRGQADAHQVEPVPLGGQRRHQPYRQRQPDDADRDVDEEHPLPAQAVDQHAADQRPHQTGDACGGTPNTHRGAATLRREDPGDHRQGLRGEHTGTHTLYDPGSDQHADAARQPTPHGGGGEHRQTDQVEVLGAEAVTEPPGHQQHHRVPQQVGAGHPDHGGVPDAQVGHDGRVGDGHDVGVENDHEETDHHRPERVPGVARTGPVFPGRSGHRRDHVPTPRPPGPSPICSRAHYSG